LAARLSRLNAWELVVWKRRAMAAKSGKPFWMHETTAVVDHIPLPPPADLADRVASHREACDPGWEEIAYHVRRSWNQDHVIAARDQIADEAVHALSAVTGLVSEINALAKRPHPTNDADSAEGSTHVSHDGFLSLGDLGFFLKKDADQAPST
jgi:hypothetical protein